MEFKRVIKTGSFQKIRKMLSMSRPEINLSGRYYTAIETCTNESHERKIKGCISLIKRSWFLTEAKHLFVKEEYRRNGIGRYLVEESLKKVKTALCGCTVREDNNASLNLFQQLGFSVVKRFRNHGNEVVFLIKEMEVQDEGR